MHIYNHTLSGHDTVSAATLFRQAQAGCRASLNALMARHDGLVQAVVRRQVLGDLPFAEALQAGRIGLWRAILGYDVKRGTAFSTYAWLLHYAPGLASGQGAHSFPFVTCDQRWASTTPEARPRPGVGNGGRVAGAS